MKVLLILIIIKLCASFDPLNPEFYVNEICSYNYLKYSLTENNSISCLCEDNYYNSTSVTYFGNSTIQCSVQRKSRFLTLFLSIFLPFGSHFLYLGFYWIFIINIFLFLLIICGNFYRFTTSPLNDFEYFKNTLNLTFLLLLLFYGFWLVTNFILVATGKLGDINGFETYNDLSILIFS